MEEDKVLNNKKILTHKLCIIQNDIKIMKDTMFDMKMEMNEMKKLIQELILVSQREPEKNYWFYK